MCPTKYCRDFYVGSYYDREVSEFHALGAGRHCGVGLMAAVRD
jgi:hypothetical protein